MIRLALVLALLTPCMRPAPRFWGPSTWPLERIRENLERRLKEDERDASAHYNLGRALALAFVQERTSLQVLRNEPVHLAPRQYEREPAGPLPTPEQKLEFLAEGMHHLRRAVELENTPEHYLTLAYLLESGARLAAQVDTVKLLAISNRASMEELATIATRIDDLASADADVSGAARRALDEQLELALPLLQVRAQQGDSQKPAVLAELLERAWVEQAIREYWKAFELGAVLEEKEVQIVLNDDPRNKGRVVPEALDSYRRLVLARGPKEAEASRIEEAERQLRELDKKVKEESITPLLLSLRGDCPTLDELTTPNLSVPFDLDGDAIVEFWPWLAPDAGWLVWDPERRGEITSGQQLFGSASAWLFFEDGYRVLDALDDDGNGELRGAELLGMAVWFDRDIDGVSDHGEVVPVEALGIVALATQATERIGPSLGNPCGLELADGRVLPTYDWFIERPGEP